MSTYANTADTRGARMKASNGIGPLYSGARESFLGVAISWIVDGLNMGPLNGGRGALGASNA